MPYRALLWTIVTVALALLAVGMWVRAVGPLLVGTEGPATQPEHVISHATTAAATRVAPAAGPETGLRRLVHGTLLLSFVLICMLLIVGLAGAFREWVRYRTAGEGRTRKRPGKTEY